MNLFEPKGRVGVDYFTEIDEDDNSDEKPLSRGEIRRLRELIKKPLSKKEAWDAFDASLRKRRKEGTLTRCWIEYLDEKDRGYDIKWPPGSCGNSLYPEG